MSNAMELNSANFDETISGGVTLVDFWAEWCAPCKLIAPVIDELAKDFIGKAVVGKVDVDTEGELAMKFQVNSIPTLIVFKNGEIASKFVGVTSKSELRKAIDAAVDGA